MIRETASRAAWSVRSGARPCKLGNRRLIGGAVACALLPPRTVGDGDRPQGVAVEAGDCCA